MTLLPFEKRYLIVVVCIPIMSGFFAAYKVNELLTLVWLIQFSQTTKTQISQIEKTYNSQLLLCS